MADYQRLFEAVERKAGRQMLTPKDFQWLEKRMFEDIHERVSTSTLMRLWGYRSGGVPRQTTLDVLARFVGYEDYVQFCRPDPTQPPLKEKYPPNTPLKGGRKYRVLRVLRILRVLRVIGILGVL